VLDIWRQADVALRQAQEIEIWGYSLAESDAAARALLNQLRTRIQEEKITVDIHVASDGKQETAGAHSCLASPSTTGNSLADIAGQPILRSMNTHTARRNQPANVPNRSVTDAANRLHRRRLF
jgi:hypothetical protein